MKKIEKFIDGAEKLEKEFDEVKNLVNGETKEEIKAKKKKELEVNAAKKAVMTQVAEIDKFLTEQGLGQNARKKSFILFYALDDKRKALTKLGEW